MAGKIAKPYQEVSEFHVGHYGLGEFAGYLTEDAHQRAAEDSAQWITRGVSKACKNDQKQLVAEFSQFEQNFRDAQERGDLRKSASLIGKKFFVHLPNELEDEEVRKISKAVLKQVPRQCAAVISEHELSANGSPHRHIQGICLIRPGGYGSYKTVPEIDNFRLNAAKIIKKTVDEELKKLGYIVQRGEKLEHRVSRAQANLLEEIRRSFLKSQGFEGDELKEQRAELRKDENFWRKISRRDDLSEQIRDHAKEQADRIKTRKAQQSAKQIYKLEEFEIFEKKELVKKKTQAPAETETATQTLENELSQPRQDGREAPTLPKREPLKITFRDIEDVFKIEFDKACDYHESLENPIPKTIAEDTLEVVAEPQTWFALAKNDSLSEESREACRTFAEKLREIPFYDRVEALGYIPNVTWNTSEERPKTAAPQSKTLRDENSALSYENAADEIYSQLNSKSHDLFEQSRQQERMRCTLIQREKEKETSDKMKEQRLKLTKPKTDKEN